MIKDEHLENNWHNSWVEPEPRDLPTECGCELYGIQENVAHDHNDHYVTHYKSDELLWSELNPKAKNEISLVIEKGIFLDNSSGR